MGPARLAKRGKTAKCPARQHNPQNRKPKIDRPELLQDTHDAETFHKLCQARRTEEGERRSFVG
jgi:hypothetical protein